MTSRAVLVLGFHRSGTSMVTRVLNLLGVDLGDEEALLGADAYDNPSGYWEPRWLIECNNAILAACGARYSEPFPGEDGWERDPALDALRERAGALLDEHFDNRPVWGFKDPRTCLTLPFWLPLVRERAGRVDVVLCVRDPSETARSMARRPYDEAIGRADWGTLWLDYTGRALAGTAGERRTLVAYDDLLTGGAAEARRLAERLELPWPDDERARELVASLDAGLRHHAASLAATAADDSLPAAARAAYVALAAAIALRRAGEGADAIRPAAGATAPGAAAELPDALEAAATALWREDLAARSGGTTALEERRRAAALHAGLVDALGALQRADVLEARLRDEIAHAGDLDLELRRTGAQLAAAQAELRQARGAAG